MFPHAYFTAAYFTPTYWPPASQSTFGRVVGGPSRQQVVSGGAWGRQGEIVGGGVRRQVITGGTRR